MTDSPEEAPINPAVECLRELREVLDRHGYDIRADIVPSPLNDGRVLLETRWGVVPRGE